MSSCALVTESVVDFARKQISAILPTSFRGRFSLAGGCFKTLLHGRPPNDLDLWPASASDRDSLLQALQNHGAEVVCKSEFNTLLRHPAKVMIEVTIKCPPSVQACVAEFDLQLSCIGVEYADGDIIDSYIFPDVDSGVTACEVRTVPRLSSMPYRLGTLKRLQHYADELAFSVPPDAIAAVWRAYAEASPDDQRAMLQLADMDETCVPEEVAVRRTFVEGRPRVPCRPFTESEEAALKLKLLGSLTPTNTQPVAVYLAGLPGAGKTVVLAEALRELGLPLLESMVNLDMDAIRAFHVQFTNELMGTPCGDGFQRQIFKDLIPWFNDGAGAEYVLYNAPNSLIRSLLQRRLDFVLPIHTEASLEFMNFVTEKHGYLPHLVVVQVPLEVAQERASRRARATGRYAAAEYIEASQSDQSALLSRASPFVQGCGGRVAVFDNTAAGGGVPPRRLSEVEIVGAAV